MQVQGRRFFGFSALRCKGHRRIRAEPPRASCGGYIRKFIFEWNKLSFNLSALTMVSPKGSNAESAFSTLLSRSRRVFRTAGMGHLERFPPERLSGRCRIGQETSAGAYCGDGLAPNSALQRQAENRTVELACSRTTETSRWLVVPYCGHCLKSQSRRLRWNGGLRSPFVLALSTICRCPSRSKERS